MFLLNKCFITLNTVPCYFLLSCRKTQFDSTSIVNYAIMVLLEGFFGINPDK